jgi:hypothetical protein
MICFKFLAAKKMRRSSQQFLSFSIAYQRLMALQAFSDIGDLSIIGSDQPLINPITQGLICCNIQIVMPRLSFLKPLCKQID